MEAFVSGHFDTHFVKLHYQPKQIKNSKEKLEEVAALFARHYWNKQLRKLTVPTDTEA